MKKKILLVDDDPSVRGALSQILLEEDYTVLPAASAVEALGLATAAKVDLVLLDLNLSGKSGWDTFERLTNDNPFLPIIVITGRSNQVFTALSAGVGALLEKPIDIPQLLKTMKRLLSESKETRLARIAGKPANFDYFPARSNCGLNTKQPQSK